MLPTNPLLNATAPAGPHLPTATLRQYAAGTLAPAARHRVEAHTLACPRCADMLEGLLQTPPATTDQALAQLQQRLRRRVQLAPQALPATRAHRRHRLMALQLAAAATLLFGLVAGGWWTWQQRYAAPTTAGRSVAPRPPAAPVATAAVGAASGVIAQAVGSLDKHQAAVAKPTPARRYLKLRTRDYIISTTTCKCNCDMDAPDLTDEPDPMHKVDIAALAEAIHKKHVASYPASEIDTVLAASLTARHASAAGTLGGATQGAGYHDSSAAGSLMGRVPGLAVRARAIEPAALVRAGAMPAAPAIPPMPVGGYGAWREKLRSEAAEFKPELPEQPLSGTVQLRLLIGADGKIQEIKVLHGLRADYDEEAQRLVCDRPGWVPGIGGGKRAAQPVDVAVPFQ